MSGNLPARALVVEDDFSWQQILGEILTDLGLQVDLAKSYEEAQAMMRKDTHRLAILDLSLGGPDHHNQDGLRVAEAVRKYDPGCVILFLTGFATVELAVQVMKEQGAFTCLRKEVFKRSDFRKIINEALTQAIIRPGESSAKESDDLDVPAAAAHDAREELTDSAPEIAVVIEDDAGWRSLLSELLQDSGFRVKTCGSYVEAIGFLKRSRCQIAVVDLSLANSISQENLDGYRLLHVLQKANIPAIVVSGYADPVRIEQAYHDRLIFSCLEKQAFDRKIFIQTVQAAGSQVIDDPVLKSLTDREREVLELLAAGLTNKEIAKDLTITPNTVKRHLKSLFVKLDVNTRAAASAKAIAMGLGRS